jgi:hypothetical protein
MSPAESFDYIYETSNNPSAVQELQPELVQRIFQFMLQEQETAAQMQKNAGAQVKSISAKL